jgi:hypothetical protein
MFKIGDLVSVKCDLLACSFYDGIYFAPEMNKFKGRSFQIKRNVENPIGTFIGYNLDLGEDEPAWTFSPSMIEFVQQINLNDFERMVTDG